MYILARADRSVLLNTVLVLSCFAVALWANTHYMVLLHGYMGTANKSADVGLYLLILAFASAGLCGGGIRWLGHSSYLSPSRSRYLGV
jgi:hypothetical protein